MIFKITKKEYMHEVEMRKRSSMYKSKFTFFHHKGNYYKSNTPKGVQALKEIHEWRQAQKVENAGLFDDNSEKDGAS